MQSILAILFVIALTIFLYVRRNKIHVEKILFPIFYFVMYRTKLGLKWMNWIARKFGRVLKPLSTFAIGVGFLGMALIVVELFRTLYKVFTDPSAPAGVGIIQPFVPDVPGTIFVPFLYFIISIIVIAVMHEGAHGVIARLYNIKIKSSGFAFLSILVPIIPAAFVEPDEEVMRKRPLKQQLAVFAAGPVTNIVTAFLVLGFFAVVMQPLVLAAADFEGIQVVGFPEGVSPAQESGIVKGDIITAINGNELEDLSNFTTFLSPYSPGETVVVSTNTSQYTVTLAQHPDNATKAFLGITPKPKVGPSPEFVAKYGKLTTTFVLWFIGLLFWMYLLSLGIGLFNLLPLGPIDGGRMLHGVLSKYLPKAKADRIFGYVSAVMLGLILFTIGGVIFL